MTIDVAMMYFIELRNAIAIYIIYLEVKKFFRRANVWKL